MAMDFDDYFFAESGDSELALSPGAAGCFGTVSTGVTVVLSVSCFGGVSHAVKNTDAAIVIMQVPFRAIFIAVLILLVVFRFN
jgi:hypothetical protein